MHAKQHQSFGERRTFHRRPWKGSTAKRGSPYRDRCKPEHLAVEESVAIDRAELVLPCREDAEAVREALVGGDQLAMRADGEQPDRRNLWATK